MRRPVHRCTAGERLSRLPSVTIGEHLFRGSGLVRRWADAEDPRPGMRLRTGAGTYVQVTAGRTRTRPDQRVHSLPEQHA